MSIQNDTSQFALFKNEAPTAEKMAGAVPPKGKYSNFIVYVDESGDHGMQSLDPHYPVFVLAFCVFYKRYYAEKVSPALQKLKFNHFGHDLLILHETEIRKESGSFRFQNREEKLRFLDELTSIIEASNFILITTLFS